MKVDPEEAKRIKLETIQKTKDEIASRRLANKKKMKKVSEDENEDENNSEEESDSSSEQNDE